MKLQVHNSGIQSTITVHVASMDIMLSHGMTSLITVGVGRGRVPLHRPTCDTQVISLVTH
jgi:hypothetical protein